MSSKTQDSNALFNIMGYNLFKGKKELNSLLNFNKNNERYILTSGKNQINLGSLEGSYIY